MKIAIVGYSSTRSEAPKDWLNYTLNHRLDLINKSDLHFDLHDTRHYSLDNSYFEFLLANQDRIIITGIDKRLDKAIIYPQKEIISKHGDYFTSSVAWMLAYAIEQNPSDIGLWGIDSKLKKEYEEQLPGILYFLGIAQGKGINIHLPDKCQLFRKNKFYWNL